MLSYELILSNIFIKMSFIVLCGWMEGAWRHKSVGGTYVRTYSVLSIYVPTRLYMRCVLNLSNNRYNY